jgi:uncharacterized protein YceK
MKSFKKFIRVVVLALLILLALSGIGIVGAFINTNRERYANKKVTIEMVEKKKGDGESAHKQ